VRPKVEWIFILRGFFINVPFQIFEPDAHYFPNPDRRDFPSFQQYISVSLAYLQNFRYISGF
jgi:hypothetical protein